MTKEELFRKLQEADMMSRKDVTEDDFSEFDCHQQKESMQAMADALELFIIDNPEWAEELTPLLVDFRQFI